MNQIPLLPIISGLMTIGVRLSGLMLFAPFFGGAVIPARIKAGLEEHLYLGNLDAKRDWGHAKDYVEAMWLMLQQEKPDDYVVATGESRSVREFLDASFGLLGLNWQDYVKTDAFYTRPSEVDFLKGDATKARKKLGWQPKISFQEMVKIMTEHDLDLAERELHAKQFQKS